MTSPAPADTGVSDPATTDAVQQALGVEHATMWALQLVTAFLPAELATPLTEAVAAHRARRDATALLLRERGGAPLAAEPAYATPTPVVDQASALSLLITTESDVATAWRSVIERTDDEPVRSLALDALTDAAVRATRWRRVAGAAPTTVPFPGAGS